MRLMLAAFGLLIAITASAQTSNWAKTSSEDPLQRVPYASYTLAGKYLRAPQRSILEAPMMVVHCQSGHHRVTNGHFLEGWIATGAVLGTKVSDDGKVTYIPVEYRLDDKKLRSENWAFTTDRTAVALSMADPVANAFCRDCVLDNLLYGKSAPHKEGSAAQIHTVVIGVPEYLGAEIEMQFDLPDSAEVADVCGLVLRK